MAAGAGPALPQWVLDRPYHHATHAAHAWLLLLLPLPPPPPLLLLLLLLLLHVC
jgi:hypothetical protein